MAPGRRGWSQRISHRGVSRSVQAGEAFPTRAEKLGKRNRNGLCQNSSVVRTQPPVRGASPHREGATRCVCGAKDVPGGQPVASRVRRQWTMSDVGNPTG